MNVGDLLSGGFRVLARRPKELLIWAVIQLVVGAAIFALVLPAYSSMLAAQQAASAGAVPSLAGIGRIFAMEIVLLIWLLMFFAAVVRMSASTGEDRFAWLRFGMDELRLIGLMLLYMVASVALWTIVFLIGAFLVGLVSIASPTLGDILGIILVIVGLCGLVWLSVRLSLMAAVVVLEHSFALRKGWRATKGHFWTLFLTFLVMFLGYIVLEIVVMSIMSPFMLQSLFETSDPQQLLAAQQQLLMTVSSPSAGLVILWFIGTVIGTLVLAYYNGVIATAAIVAIGYSQGEPAAPESHFA